MTRASDSNILPGGDDTIAAIATASGRGALAIVRVSGPRATAIASEILRPPPTSPGVLQRCDVHDDNVLVDESMAVLHRAPRSFTGEDMLEITTHGGHVVPAAVLAASVRHGARLATPGEFTRRAVLHGKIDLLQAEAIGDLIDARSRAAQRMALQQLDGGLSRRLMALRDDLLALEALLAYDMDFPEEDDGPVPRARVDEATLRIEASLHQLLSTRPRSAQVRNGALVVLAGAPNAGKSSLFNALLGEARAIVTEIPGTTRDAIEAVLDVPGWPLRLVDTAGLRDTTEPIEQLGIETTTRYMQRAAIVLACVDSTTPATSASVTGGHTGGEVIVVRTKADLVANSEQIAGDISVSATTGEGLRALIALIENRLMTAAGTPELDSPALTRTRHEAAVQRAASDMRLFHEAWTTGALPSIVAATHIRGAVNALGELIGAVSVDDVLDVVFRSFCVGK